MIPNIDPDQRAAKVFALLKTIAKDYKYVGVLHFSGATTDFSQREAVYKCMKSLLYSASYLSNVFNQFEANPRLGLVMPPAMYHGQFWSAYGKEGFKYSKEIAMLSEAINVPYEEGEALISPCYGAFWCKSDALNEVFSMLKPTDEKILLEATNQKPYQFLDCVWSLLFQAAGYYSSYIMDTELAQLELTNTSYYLTTLNGVQESDTVWQLQSQMRYLNEYASGVKNNDIDYWNINFTLIPRGVMVRQTIKKFCPASIWNFLRKIIKGY